MTDSPPVLTPITETRTGCADGHTAARWRHELHRWLQTRIDVDAQRRSDMVLAVNEALANCVDHAYGHLGDARGRMTLEVEYDPADVAVKVCVTDRGRWVDPDVGQRDSTRGRGLVLMYALADACTIDGRSEGTTVCLHFHNCPTHDNARQQQVG